MFSSWRSRQLPEKIFALRCGAKAWKTPDPLLLKREIGLAFWLIYSKVKVQSIQNIGTYYE